MKKNKLSFVKHFFAGWGRSIINSKVIFFNLSLLMLIYCSAHQIWKYQFQVFKNYIQFLNNFQNLTRNFRPTRNILYKKSRILYFILKIIYSRKDLDDYRIRDTGKRNDLIEHQR